MELNDYLSSLNENLRNKLDEINKRENEILGRLYGSSRTVEPEKRQSESPDRDQKSKVLTRLIREERLEDMSQSKLGTFEKIYREIFQGETGAPMSSYGFGDLDFSPLVNPLMSILEIELNRSLYQEIRRINGIDMTKYYFKNAPSKQITVDGKTYELGSKKQMLGGLKALISYYRNELSGHMADPAGFTGILSKVINVRNGASHDSYIDKDSFMAFYESYSQLFNGSIGQLMDLKKRLASCAQKNDLLFAYASEKEDPYIKALVAYTSGDRKKNNKRGILMTDCASLSMKYFGDTDYTEMLREFFTESVIPAYKQFRIDYQLLDIEDGYRQFIKDGNDWKGYHKALYSYCKDNQITTDEPIALFIIGGNDVIPMPRIFNPAQTGHGIMEETLDADLLYCYKEEYIRMEEDIKLDVEFLMENLSCPDFYVGRLPLENGLMVTSIENDLVSYFKEALLAHSEGGINIKSPLFTTCHRGQKCGKLLTEGMPLKSLPTEENIFVDNMAVSPALMLETEKKTVKDSKIMKNMGVTDEMLDEAFGKYVKQLSGADMLMFFLHGGYNPSHPVYSGDAILMNEEEKEKERISPAVFGPWLLKSEKINIKSIAAVSCYGARFIDYNRNDSTLLTSIYNGTLLFYGSSRIAFGPFDDCLKYLGERLGWALQQMREYLLRLFGGIPAGEAINRAKLAYLRGLETPYEEDKTTILEFNLFGDPLLNVKKLMEPPVENETEVPDLSLNRKNIRRYETVYTAEAAQEKTSLLQRIRGMVDRNLEGIHKKITEQLYNELSLNPRDLYTIRSFSDTKGNSGYSYCYRQTNDAFDACTIVETDRQGTIKSKIETI